MYNRDTISVGIHISRARREKRLSQHQLAQLAGVDSADISSVESGDFDPKSPQTEAIVFAVGLPIKILEALYAPKAKPTAKQLNEAYGLRDSGRIVNLEEYRKTKWRLTTMTPTD